MVKTCASQNSFSPVPEAERPHSASCRTVAHRGGRASKGAIVKNFSDLTGQKISRLTVVALLPPTGMARQYLCKCDCGTQNVKRTSSQLNDKSHPIKSCGCAVKDAFKNCQKESRKALTKFSHPLKLKLKIMRGNMIKRCHRPGTRRFERYGGRGISVCQEWRDNPTAFYQWAILNGFQDGLWIERKDVNGNYCAENCTFTTPKDQANNTCRNRFLEHGELRLTVAQWAEKLGTKPQRIWKRIARGWSAKTILETPFLTKNATQAVST